MHVVPLARNRCPHQDPPTHDVATLTKRPPARPIFSSQPRYSNLNSQNITLLKIYTFLPKMKTPVTCLEEYASQRKLPRATYEFQEKSMCGLIRYVCFGSFSSVTVEAEGRSKKVAKQNAALKLMKEFGVHYEEPQMITTKTNFLDYVGKMTEFFSYYKGWPSPTYEILPKKELKDEFCCVCTFVDFKTKGYGMLRKSAKQEAAKHMFLRIEQKGIERHFEEIRTLEEKFAEQQYDYTTFGRWSIYNKSDIERKERLFNRKKEKTLRKIKNIMKTEDKRKPFVKLETWEKLQEYMTLQGWHHEVTILHHKEPCKLSLKINELAVIGLGITEEDAYTGLLKTMNTFLEAGLDFTQTEIDYDAMEKFIYCLLKVYNYKIYQ